MKPPPRSSSVPALFRWWPWLLLAAAGATIVGAKLRMIALYGTDVPFGDQWFGEAAAAYLPYLRGELHGTDLFAAHNEHRIVFTRLLDLALLAANGQWDGRLQLVANAAVHTGFGVIFLAFALRVPGTLARVIYALAGAILFSTSIAWENTLWAFQSQFYFLLFFSLLHLVLSFAVRRGSIGWWLGQAAGFAVLFTLAGGWLSALAGLATVCIQIAVTRRVGWSEIWLLAWNAGLIALGVSLGVHVAAHDGLRSASAGAFLGSLYHFLSWPMQRLVLGWLVYLPFAAFLVSHLRIRNSGARETTLIALGFFALLECAALAYARGAIFSRYADTLAFGVMVNLVCLLELPLTPAWRNVRAAVAGAWLALVIGGVWAGEDVSYAVTLSHQDETNHAREHAVRAYVGAKDFAALRDGEHWSYSETVAIAAVLDVPALQQVLPPSVRAPLRTVPAQSDGFSPLPMSRVPDLSTRDDLSAWAVAGKPGDNPGGIFLSEPMQSRLPIVTIYVTGRVVSPGAELGLKTRSGQIVASMQSDFDAAGRWKKINFSAPTEPFQLFARSADPHTWFAFTAPVETGRLGWLAGKGIAAWPLWFWGAGTLAALALALLARLKVEG